MYQVFKMIFTQNSYELNNEYSKLSEHEKETIANILPDGYFEFNDKLEQFNLFLIITKEDLDRYAKILDENFIRFKLKNITKDLLNGLDIQEHLKDYINPLNRHRFNTFKMKLEEWINQNLDIDTILDRINQIGIENLTKLEIKFLDNYKV
jgi:hypothetical protein